MTTLTELMREATADQPMAGLVDPAEVTGLGRRRVRRRRTTAALVAAAVVAVAVTPFAVRAVSGPDRVAAPLGRALSLDSATPAVAGRDFTELGSVTARMLTVGSDRLGVQGTLPDGRLVVARVHGLRETTVGNGLLQPENGTVAWLPARRVGLYLGRAGDRLVYGTPATAGDSTTGPDRPYQVFDTAAGTWRSLPRNAAVDREWGGSRQSQVVGDGMLWVALDTQPTATLWRVPLDGSGGWTRVGTVGTFGVGAGTLAYTDSSGAPGHRLTLRDLADGTEHTVPLPDTGRCDQEGVTVSASYVVLELSCGASGPGLSDRLVVLDRAGRALATVAAGYLEPTAVTSGLVGFAVPSTPDNAPYVQDVGSYVYRPATRQLVRLSGHAVAMGPFHLPGDPVQRWHTDSRTGGRPGAVLFDVVVPH